MCEYMCVQGKITSVGRVYGGEGNCGGEEGILVEGRGDVSVVEWISLMSLRFM